MPIAVPSYNLILCLTEAINLISPVVVNHHKHVACIAYYLSEELGLSKEEQLRVTYAGALHDLGGLSTQERQDALQFEYNNSNMHAERGYLLLNTFTPYSSIAKTVRYHHTQWNNGNCIGKNNEEIPYTGHLLHIADRIAVLINSNQTLLSQVDSIQDKIMSLSGIKFMPEIVQAFMRLSKKECFWLNVTNGNLTDFLQSKFSWDSSMLEGNDLIDLVKLFSRIIDFRSRFTTTHSSGVAVAAESISRLVGFPEDQSQLMKLAGYIHDIGKLAVSEEILEKPAKLSLDEYAIVRTHTYFTYRILSLVSAFEEVKEWGAYHHERLDGSGYPFHLKGDALSTGARIMAIADIFVALSEDRPYRMGMSRDKALEIIHNMADSGFLDTSIVLALENNYDIINEARIQAQNSAVNEYNAFMNELL